MEREEPANLPTELQISIGSPSKREIVNAIKAMKNGKAAGADNIPAEVLKADPYMSADILLLSTFCSLPTPYLSVLQTPLFALCS